MRGGKIYFRESRTPLKEPPKEQTTLYPKGRLMYPTHDQSKSTKNSGSSDCRRERRADPSIKVQVAMKTLCSARDATIGQVLETNFTVSMTRVAETTTPATTHVAVTPCWMSGGNNNTANVSSIRFVHNHDGIRH